MFPVFFLFFVFTFSSSSLTNFAHVLWTVKRLFMTGISILR